MLKLFRNWLFDKLISFLTINKLHKEIDILYSEINKLRQIIKDRTDLHADIGYKSPNCIIAVGKYRNQDYVQVYNIYDSDFEGFIHHLRDMEKYGRVGRLDAPPTMRAVFKHEFGKL